MGIEFPKGFEERIMKQDLSRRLDESGKRARAAIKQRNAIVKDFLKDMGIPADNRERRIYKLLLSQPKGKGITLDDMFMSLDCEWTTGEIKDVLQKLKSRRHVRYDPFGWMLVEEIHHKFWEIKGGANL